VAEVVGRFGSLDLYRQASSLASIPRGLNCLPRGYTRTGSDTRGRNGERFLPATTQAVVRYVAIILLHGIRLPGFCP
jgi:hypothetical protein